MWPACLGTICVGIGLIPLYNGFGLLLLVYERFFGPPGQQLLTWVAYGGLGFLVTFGTWLIVTDLIWFRSLS